MQPVKIFAMLTFCVVMSATIIDQIAIIVRDSVIKDSDIERDIRVVDFLNEEKLTFDIAARKAAANRLIDQALIRREIGVGEYRTATEAEAERLLDKTQKEQYYSPAVFNAALQKYGLTREELKQYLRWQLTVLRFIDERFRPAVLITDDDVAQYYREHTSEFRNASTGQTRTLDEAGDEIRNKLIEERVNKQFDSWLDARRKSANVEYKEEALK
jgi:hypothetical protein